jgi:hypothetical protein
MHSEDRLQELANLARESYQEATHTKRCGSFKGPHTHGVEQTAHQPALRRRRVRPLCHNVIMM